MAIATLELPDGRVAEVEVPDGIDNATLQSQLNSMYERGDFDNFQSQEPAPDNPRNFYRDLQRAIDGGLEVGLTMGSAVMAEPFAGLAGIGAMLPGGRTPTEAIQATREALTYKPQTPKGQEFLQSTGEALQPVAEAISSFEDGLGDSVFEKTGSPALAAFAKSSPTLAVELLGVGVAKGVKGAKASRGAKQARELVQQAAPSTDILGDVSRGLIKEVDNMGATVDPNKFRVLAYEIAAKTRKEGADPRISPKASGVVQNIFDDAKSGEPITFTELDTLRKMAKGAADEMSKHESMLGTIIVEKIDDFMGSSGILSPDMDEAIGPQVAARLKVHRDLWGRMRRGELIENALYKAQNMASGPENGIRTQFRQILQSDKKRKFFKPDELRAMEEVVRGTAPANLMKLLGKFGFGEQQATNMLGGSISSGAGAAIGNAVAGPPGAVVGAMTTAGAGSLARRTARKMTEGAADRASAVIRAGENADDIARMYLQSTAKPNPEELAEIFLRRSPNVPSVQELDEFTRRALEIAQRKQAELAAAASVGATERSMSENVVPLAIRGAR